MAKMYRHKQHGYQISYRIWISGNAIKKNRYSKNKHVADELYRIAEFIERGSRSCNLSPREIVQARHDGLLSESEAYALSGENRVEKYDLDLIFEKFRAATAVSHTPGSHAILLRKSKFIIAWLRNHPIPTLTTADLNEYLAQRKSGKLVFRNERTGFARIGVASKTLNTEIIYFRLLIDEAKKMGMVSTNVARDINVPTKTSKFRVSIKRSEIAPLLKSAEEHSHLLNGFVRQIILVALYTGLRREEIRTLCWSDINFDTQKITVQSKSIPGETDFTPKSGKPETVTIPDVLLPVLAAMDRRGRFVFGGDKPYNCGSITNAVASVCRRAGLSGITLHSLRHTYCSWLLKMTGGDLKYVQSAARHSSIRTTAGYLHDISDDDAPVRSLEFK